MKKNNYKVIVIGAGPAGLSTALNLYKLGIKDIIVIEKYQFPRYKCCAGYITGKTVKAYKDLGLDINNCHYSFIDDFNIFYKYKLKQKINNKFLYTNRNIDRVELDNKFYELAKQKGIDVKEKSFVIEHNCDERYVVLSNNKKLYYDYLVFADGTNSYGNRYCKKGNKNIAMQLVFESNRKDSIEIHFGITKKGYAWVSSYQGITNVGITDVFNNKVNYEKVFERLLAKLDLKADISKLKGANTPIGIRTPIINANVFFVGDAVGACDPLTLSGLRYGLATGRYCAEAIKYNDSSIYLKYIKKLKIKFSLMYFMLKVFYLKSTLFCVFDVGCRFFGRFISYVFNNFFVNKK